MLSYYILIFSPFVLSLVNIKGQTKQKKNAILISVFFATYLLMLMLRHYTIGRDVPNYVYLFPQFSSVSWKEIFNLEVIEPAYTALNKIILYFTNDPQWLIIITSIITILPIWYLYKQQSANPLLSISIFLIMPTFVMFFSGLRQSIAIAIGVWAYQMVKKRKLVLFTLLVILAMLFHRSAFILFALYPLYHVKISKISLLFVAPVLALIFIFNKPIFSALRVLIADIYELEIGDTGAYTMLVLFILFAIYSFWIVDDKNIDEETAGLRNILLLALVLQMFVPLHNLAMRMNYYYIIFIPLLIPRIIERASIRWIQVANISKYVMTVYFLVYFFNHAPSGNILDTFPYRFFWEDLI